MVWYYVCRILGVYKIDPWDQPPIKRTFRDIFMAAALLQTEKDNDLANALKVIEVTRMQVC